MKTQIRKAMDPIRADDTLIGNTRKALAHRQEQMSRTPQRGIRRRLVTTMAVLLSCLLVVAGSVAFLRFPTAAISLDATPSIEIQVNAFRRVLSVEAFNPEGEVLLEGLQLEGRPATQAIQAVIAAAVQAGYVQADGASIISVATASGSDRLRTKLEARVEQAIHEALGESGQEAVVYGEAIGLDRVQEARELQITPGKLNLIQKLIELDPDRTVEELMDMDPADIMKQVVGLRQAAHGSDDKGQDVIEPEGNTGKPDFAAKTLEKALEKAAKAAEKNARKEGTTPEPTTPQTIQAQETIRQTEQTAETVRQTEQVRETIRLTEPTGETIRQTEQAQETIRASEPSGATYRPTESGPQATNGSGAGNG